MTQRIAQILLAGILVGTAVVALLKNGAVIPTRRFVAWPVVAGAIVEALLIAFAGGWG